MTAPLSLPEVDNVVLHGRPIFVEDDIAMTAVGERLPLHHALCLPHEALGLAISNGSSLATTLGPQHGLVPQHWE